MIKKITSLFVLTVLLYACSSSSSDNPSPNPTVDNFNRGEMLTHLANSIIIPSFSNFNDKLTDLKAKTTSFTSNPTQATLNNVRTSWYNAYKAWQHIEMFNIGKAEELQFVNHFNIYPVEVADIEKNATTGTYDLNHSNNHDAQGFPALDYLLYGIASTDATILAKYTTDANATKYKAYFTAIVTKMTDVNTAILNDWKGGYATTFASSTTNTATSSLNMLVNDFIYYYEKGLRANKIGIPAGVWSATPLPTKVEAFYRKDISKELTLEALTAVENFFIGKAFNGTTTGQSFKTYLEGLNRSDLATKIINQLKKGRAEVNKLDNNYYQQIKTDNTKMTKAYDELQKVVVLIKTDMLQAFNVTVDYVDADGD